MPDYQKLYLKMFNATEKAIEILVNAQKECEEMYISQQPKIDVIINKATQNEKTKNKP